MQKMRAHIAAIVVVEDRQLGVAIVPNANAASKTNVVLLGIVLVIVKLKVKSMCKTMMCEIQILTIAIVIECSS